MSLTKLRKTDLGSTTAVFRDKLNSWHVPKCHSAYAMQTNSVHNVRGISLLLRVRKSIHSFIHFL